MWELLDYDILRQQVPAFFYKRIPIASHNALKKYYFNVPIDQGFVYLLREVSWRGGFIQETNGRAVNDYRIEFKKSTRGRLLQSEPYPANLISTPSYQNGIFAVAPQPVDNTAFNVNPDAIPPLKNRLILNYLYQHKELIEVTWINNRSGFTSYIDTLLCGYYIPDKALKQWS